MVTIYNFYNQNLDGVTSLKILAEVKFYFHLLKFEQTEL